MITSDWQAELAGVTIGAGTKYHLLGPVSGLGIPAPRTADAERGDLPGDVAGRDVLARRVLTVPVGIDGSDAAEAMSLFDALKAAWTPTASDVTFEVRLPGFAGVSRRFYGRPRGFDSDLTLLRLGWVDVLASFDALDPFGYGPEVTADLDVGDTVTMNGSAPCDRWVMVLDVTDSPASVAVDGAVLTIDTTPGTVILDGRTRTVVDPDGVDLYATVEPGSSWPVLAPGENTVTVTGASGTVTYRAGYL